MRELKWLPRRSGLWPSLDIRILFGLFLVLSVFGTTWSFMPHTLPKAHANGSNPIKHIVFIIKENHSFDNYFGRFPGVNGVTSGMVKVNGVDQPITLTPIIDQSPDYCHVWKCHIQDYDNGAMDHFNAVGAC
ncbi:MAG TPA: alkaline phosphatase family protein, partial [Ktedonobacteraceae bacterium]|nr:alkaline phosphatase family protein [Ktedonobacteraceae bacterium]